MVSCPCLAMDTPGTNRRAPRCLVTPIGVYGPLDIAQPCIRLQRRLRKSFRRAESKDRQYSNKRIYKVTSYQINPPYEREIRWHSSRITVETGLNERGQHAHGASKTKEEGREGCAAQS